ncbi:MAG TPA: 3' terminal RNA ribose 2'-O-methyltransferase Hen1, partial [Myxococcales bacterium]|nr:3' terminal RNA ribose 2'-O-methyltransferase Hen1 [Myxococcales bacterium]
MLFSITTTHPPARDLGYLLYKHPDRLHTKSLAFGRATVFFPEASDEETTAVLFLDIDPIGLVRRAHKGQEFALHPYVNDRPYAACSFLSVAIARMFGSALKGICEPKPELAQQALPWQVHIPTLPCRGGDGLLRRLFEPLGYQVEATHGMLDPNFPEWGPSPYHDVTLNVTCTLSMLLKHLYVLIPVFDDEKHYWVSHDEVEKLLSAGQGWIEDHPAKELITRRYLIHQRALTQSALERLEDEPLPHTEETTDTEDADEETQTTLRLHDHRLDVVAQTLKKAGVTEVIDLGCGDGKLLKRLFRIKQFKKIVGTDISTQSLKRAAKRLRLDQMTDRMRARIDLFQSSLTYKDQRFANFEGAAIVEVIEHIDENRLSSFARVVFEQARPGVVVLTTPN